MGSARSRRGLRAAGVPALVLTLLLLAGCTGDGEVAAFQRAFADDPAIQEMELTSHDNQPFTGGVSGDVVARSGLSDDEAVRLVGRLSDYTRENRDRMQGRVTLAVDGIQLSIAGDDELDVRAAHLLTVLRADGRVVSAFLGERALGVTGDGAPAAIGMAGDLPDMIDGMVPGLSEGLRVRSADGAVDIGGGAITRGAALRLWHALQPDVALTGIRVRDDARIVVTLQREADLTRAERAVAREGFDEGTKVVFASDLVRLGEADGEEARALLAKLSDHARARIAWVWTSGARIEVAVRAEVDIAAMAAEVEAALPAAVDEASLRWEGDPDTRTAIRP